MSGVKKTSVHPFVGYHLLHPWYSPIYYTPWLSLSLLHIFEPFGYHLHISFPLLHPFYILFNPLATTHTSLSPTTPLLHIFEPFGYHSYIPFLLYYTPLTYCWTLWLPLLHPFSPITPQTAECYFFALKVLSSVGVWNFNLFLSAFLWPRQQHLVRSLHFSIFPWLDQPWWQAPACWISKCLCASALWSAF